MGKGSATVDRPGASAAAEWRRARQAARRRTLVTAALALGALGLAAVGGATDDPRLFVAAALFAVLAWLTRPEPDADRWRRGAEGEVATAALLDRLPRRFVVLNDRRQPGTRGNLDHIVIGPTGVWIVDSKVRRAPLRIRRGQVWAGDHTIDVAPVATQAERVSHILGVPVGAIVAVHGIGLRRRGKGVDGVRIVPARWLVHRLRRRSMLFRRRTSHSDVVALVTLAGRAFPPA